MSLLDRVKERTASDLPDAELQAMIDAITAELDGRFGPIGETTVKIGDPGEPASRAMRHLRSRSHSSNAIQATPARMAIAPRWTLTISSCCTMAARCCA